MRRCLICTWLKDREDNRETVSLNYSHPQGRARLSSLFLNYCQLCGCRVHKSKYAVTRALQRDCTHNLWLYLWLPWVKTHDLLFIVASDINKTTSFFLVFPRQIPTLVSAEQRRNCSCHPFRNSPCSFKHSCPLFSFLPYVPSDFQASEIFF